MDGVTTVVGKTSFPDNTGEDFGRNAAWHSAGTRR